MHGHQAATLFRRQENDVANACSTGALSLPNLGAARERNGYVARSVKLDNSTVRCGQDDGRQLLSLVRRLGDAIDEGKPGLRKIAVERKCLLDLMLTHKRKAHTID